MLAFELDPMCAAVCHFVCAHLNSHVYRGVLEWYVVCLHPR